MNHTAYEEVKDFSIFELLNSGQYKVPIYQRNYAWREIEIEQLLQDLFDSATQYPKTPNYYLGSLVVHRHDDSLYEIIDGQQRHTTLCILLAVLKNDYKQNLACQNGNRLTMVNLGFDCRPLSENTLRILFESGIAHDGQNLEPAILNAYKIIAKFLKSKRLDESVVSILTTYLLNNVKILRVIVPEKTDLNHYFEIMNNRGEQLEKHEILKARLMESLEKHEQTGFSRIWDACADMRRYVQRGFSAAKRITESDDISERNAIFGSCWDECPLNFEEFLKKLLVTTTPVNDGTLLADILKSPAFKASKSTTGTDLTGKLGSVINFQNFLLHVLLALNPKHATPLDDKRLLDTFDNFKVDSRFPPIFAKKFIMALLRMRLLFDRFIVKSENERWRLKTITPNARNEKNISYYPKNSFSDAYTHDQLEMLLSMFHVSYPAQTHKHWLSGAIHYLYSQNIDRTKLSIDGNQYLCYLERLSDKFFFGCFGADNADSPAVSIKYDELVFGSTDSTLTRSLGNDVIDQGTHVENFIFNRLDYLLWKRIRDNEIPSYGTDSSVDVKKLGEEFRFTFRSSVEHYYPQRPRDENVPRLANCDVFGNLCLISHHNNSRYSDLLPNAKKELRASSKSNESLKQVFMMSYTQWGPGNEEIIKKHHEEMVAILCSRAKCECVK